MQTFTITLSLPDECDPSAILEKIQEIALDLAFESGADEDFVSDHEQEIEDSVSVCVGDTLANIRQNSAA